MTRSTSGLPLRILTTEDVPAGLALSSAAGWNQTAQDWAMLMELAPDTCFGLDCDGHLAATTTLVCYGSELAWLGMVLTRSDARRRGFARLLVERALSVADARSIRTVKLDATEQGLPLYQRFGFRQEQFIERWTGNILRGQPSQNGAKQLSAKQIAALDRGVFGADRLRLLDLLAQHSEPISYPNGFVFFRPGIQASYLGPCVAVTDETARSLVGKCLSNSGGRWFWDILSSNAAAAKMAKELGFAVDRSLIRMSRGSGVSSKPAQIFASAGFEMG